MMNYGMMQGGGGNGIASEIVRVATDLIGQAQMSNQMGPQEGQVLTNMFQSQSQNLADWIRRQYANPDGSVYASGIRQAVSQMISEHLPRIRQSFQQQQQMQSPMGGGMGQSASPPMVPSMMNNSWQAPALPQAAGSSTMSLYGSNTAPEAETTVVEPEDQPNEQEESTMHEHPQFKELSPVDRTQFSAPARRFRDETTKKEYYSVELDWPIPISDYGELAEQAKHIIDSSSVLSRRNTLVGVRAQKMHCFSGCPPKSIEKGVNSLKECLKGADEKSNKDVLDILRQFDNTHLKAVSRLLQTFIHEYMYPIQRMALLFDDPKLVVPIKTIDDLEDLFYPHERITDLEDSDIPDDYVKRLHIVFRGLVEYLQTIKYMNPSDPRTQLYTMSALTREFGIPALNAFDNLSKSLSLKVESSSRNAVIQNTSKVCHNENTCVVSALCKVLVACREDIPLMHGLGMLDTTKMFQSTSSRESDEIAITSGSEQTTLLEQLGRMIGKPLFGYPLFITKDNYRVGIWVAKGHNFDEYSDLHFIRM